MVQLVELDEGHERSVSVSSRLYEHLMKMLSDLKIDEKA